MKRTTIQLTSRICCMMRMQAIQVNVSFDRADARFSFYIGLFATIFQFLLYTLSRFGYNITDNANQKEMRDHTYEH